jgi:predicted metal-binding protein
MKNSVTVSPPMASTFSSCKLINLKIGNFTEYLQIMVIIGAAGTVVETLDNKLWTVISPTRVNAVHNAFGNSVQDKREMGLSF